MTCFSTFALVLQTKHIARASLQGGQGRARDEALTKRSEYEDFIDLNESLRADRASSVVNFGRLKLGIKSVRFDASSIPPLQLGVVVPHAAACARGRCSFVVLSS